MYESRSLTETERRNKKNRLLTDPGKRFSKMREKVHSAIKDKGGGYLGSGYCREPCLEASYRGKIGR